MCSSHRHTTVWSASSNGQIVGWDPVTLTAKKEVSSKGNLHRLSLISSLASIWDPRKGVENRGCHQVEMVQRCTTRWVLSRYHPLASVTDMLQELGWRSLELRRAVTRLVNGHIVVKLDMTC